MNDRRAQAAVTYWWGVAIPAAAITLYVAYEVFTTDPSVYSEAARNTTTAPTGGVLELLIYGTIAAVAYLVISRMVVADGDEVSGDE